MRDLPSRFFKSLIADAVNSARNGTTESSVAASAGGIPEAAAAETAVAAGEKRLRRERRGWSLGPSEICVDMIFPFGEIGSENGAVKHQEQGRNEG
jgi:hypothetical protein